MATYTCKAASIAVGYETFPRTTKVSIELTSVNLDALNETVITLDKRWKLYIASSGVCTGGYKRSAQYPKYDCNALYLSVLPVLGTFENQRKALVSWSATDRSWTKNGSFAFSLQSGILEYSNPTGLFRTLDWSETHFSCPKCFTLSVTLKEEENNINIQVGPNAKSQFRIARHIKEPNEGDVVFFVRDSENTVRKLSAYKSILSTNCEFFERRFSPTWTAAGQNTETPNDNGDLLKCGDDSKNPRNNGCTLRQDIGVADNRYVVHLDDPEDDIDFVTLHNILYYIYTGVVNLHTNAPDPEELPQGYPEEPDPYELYRNADKFLLPELKETCLEFIEAALTPTRVVEWLFDIKSDGYETLKAGFIRYLAANFKEIRDTEAWRTAFSNIGEAPSSVRSYQLSLIQEIMSQLPLL